MRFIPAGTRVRLKVPTIGGGRGIGTLMEDAFADALTQVMLDGGPAHCLSNEIAVLRDQTPGPPPMRQWLPYGKWTCADGREVLFNRDYTPIWQRRPGDPATAADAGEWVLFERQEWFFCDETAPWWSKPSVAKAAIRRCEGVLREWRVFAA